MLSIVLCTLSLSIFVTNFKVDLPALKQSCALLVSVFALRNTILKKQQQPPPKKNTPNQKKPFVCFID